MNENYQSVKNQKGEIEFRRKLVEQQVFGKTVFEDEFNKEGLEKILLDRMKETFDRMIDLHMNMNVKFHPLCIELGAERCQRSLIMENDIGVKCIALDISYDMLKSCNYYKDVFNKNKEPIRVCCDINNLPIRNNSIPFIFCYQTLHHFPNPKFITKEVHRILLPGGNFFFDDEGFKNNLHINLYKPKKIYSKDKLIAGRFEQIIDYFFSIQNCNEIEYGIIENDAISINAWKDILSFF